MGHYCERKSLKSEFKMSKSISIISLQMTGDIPKYQKVFQKCAPYIEHSAKENKQMAMYLGRKQNHDIPKGIR